MFAIGINQYGDPSVFEQLAKDTPEPKANQVLLKTKAVGINPYDALLRSGSQQHDRPLPFPIIPGTDVVGEIAAVGADVTDFKVGQQVINLRPLRGYSEYVTASTGKIVPLPKGLDLTLAASLPTAGYAAYNITHHFLPLEAGKTIAIIGASGTVGALTTQIAKSLGLHVIAIGAEKNGDFMSKIGADELGFYDTETVGQKFENQADYVVNAASGGQDHGMSNMLIKPGRGFIATVGDLAPAVTKAGVRVAYVHQDKIFSTQVALNFLVKLATTTGLALRIDTPLAFDVAGITTAHQRIENHQTKGHQIAIL
ncbi:MAG: NADP-dependent oxidoreductase [Lactobacillus sp.]|nr:NADP-dependent oxidoreductase [Lactobacillus sp.]